MTRDDWKPRLLDLFGGAQGAGVGYARAGFEVTSVDIEEHDKHPEIAAFIKADALEVLADRAFLSRFQVIHASPPCQSFTAYRRRGQGVGASYPNLIPQVRDALIEWGGSYVIENVPGSPLIEPLQLCGSSFDLDVRRHRLFESNEPLKPIACNHSWQTPRFPPATNRTNLRSTVEVGVWRIPLATQQAAMGIDWMSLRDLTESIPPAYTEYIGRQLIERC